MPYSSSQVSEMVGGQMTMFANNAQYAQRVGATHGTAPMWAGQGGMSSPSFGSAGYGHQWLGGNNYNTTPGGAGVNMVGGAVQGMGGMATGVSLAAGFGMMGTGMGAYMDPFTGVGRAFAGGAGFGGQGAMATMRGIGGMGLRGGMGAIGGGMMAAAAPAALYYGAYKAASAVGENLYAGAQSVNQVGGMMQNYMGPSFGSGAGGRPGGRQSRQEILSVVESLNELASDDVMITLKSAKSLADKIGQMGMLTGATDAASFKQKFRAAVSQVRDIAKMMGTTLDEAAPMLGQFQKMGLWTTQDITGTSATMRAVGKRDSGVMLQGMQMGAQQAHARGGSMAAGAMGAQRNFMLTQGLMRTGALSNQDLMEYTGGVGGAQGQAMLGQGMNRMMQGMMRGPMGRAMMAGLAEMEDGKVTGNVDQERMSQFLSGGVGARQLISRGRRALSTREGLASFSYRSNALQQNIASEGGVEGLARGLQGVLQNTPGFGAAGEEIQGLMLQRLTGGSQRDAQMIQKIMKNIGRAAEDAEHRRRDALAGSLREYDEKRRSLDGMMEEFSNRWESRVEAPIQNLGARWATNISDRIDTLGDRAFGRSKGYFDVSSRGERQVLRSLSDQGISIGQMAQQAGPGGLDLDSGFMGGFLQNKYNMSRKELVQTFERPGDRNAQALSRYAIRAGGNQRALGYSKDQSEDAAIVKKAYANWSLKAGQEGGALYAATDRWGRDADITSTYAAELFKKDMPHAVRHALTRLSGGAGGNSTNSLRDLMAISVKEHGDHSAGRGPNFQHEAQLMGWAALGEYTDDKTAAERAEKALQGSLGALGAEGGTWGGLAVAVGGGASVGGAVGAAPTLGVGAPIGAAIGGVVGLGAWAIDTMTSDLTQESVTSALKNEDWGSAMQDWVAGGAESDATENPFLQAAAKGGQSSLAAKMRDHILKAKRSGRLSEVQEGWGGFRQERHQQIASKALRRIKGAATKERDKFFGRMKLDARSSAAYGDVLAGFESGDGGEFDSAIAAAQAAASGLSDKEMERLGLSGSGVGGMMAAFGAVGRGWKGMGTGTGKRGASKFGAKMRQIGAFANFDVEGSMSDKDQELIQRMLKSDSGLDAKEVNTIKELVTQTIESFGPQTRDGRDQKGVALDGINQSGKDTVTLLTAIARKQAVEVEKLQLETGKVEGQNTVLK